jgi:hypothetical protein
VTLLKDYDSDAYDEGTYDEGEAPARRVIVHREHVPSKKVVIVKAPDGTPIGRWAKDERSVENVLGNLTKDGDMPGGHKELGCVLGRDPKRSYPDLALFSTIELQGVGGEVLWQGTLRQQPQSDGDRIAIEPKAVGDRQLLEDDETAVIGFINSDQSAWTEPSAQRRIDLNDEGIAPAAASTSSASAGAGSASPSLLFDFTGVTSTGEAPRPGAELWFDGRGVELGALLFDQIGDASAGWFKSAGLSEDDLAKAIDDPTNYSGVAESFNQRVEATGRRMRAFLQVIFAGSFVGQMTNLQRFENVKVQGTQGLALQGTWPNVGYTAKQMLPFIAEGAGLTTVDELLEDDEFVIPQAWFSDPGTWMSKLVDITKYGLLDWFVLNDRILQYRFPGTYGRRWRLDSGSAPKSSGPDANRVWDRLTVTWQDVDGTTKRAQVGPLTDERNAAVAAGRPRGKLLALNGVLNEELAIKTAERFLEEAAELDQSGEATLSGFVQEHTTGVWYPVEYVQPGDRVVEPITGLERKITSAPWSDDQAAVNVTLGAPPEGLAALEDRFDAKLTELGLGS